MPSTNRVISGAVVLALVLLQATTWAQSSTFSNLRFVHNTYQKGVKGIAIYFDLDLRGHKGDSGLAITATINDMEGQPTMATPDATHFQGTGGILRDSFVVSLPRTQPVQRQLGVFFPYYAISLRPGKHERLLAINLVNKAGGAVQQRSAPVAFSIEMPGRRMHRVQMQELETLETDINGETWDYVLLSAREIHPELEWVILRGNSVIFRSERARNTLRLDVDPATNVSPLFGLAEGDSLTLRVEDFDLMTSSDLIGTRKISPHAADRPADLVYDGGFGRVKKCRFSLEETVLPAFQVQELSVKPLVRMDGVTGFQCQLKYQVEPYPNGGKLRVGIEAPGSGKDPLAHFLWMQEGPALFSPDHHLVLHAATGKLDFFIPWFAFESMDVEMIRLAAEVQFDNGNRYPIGWFTEQWPPVAVQLQDFAFGQQKIVPDSSQGVHGLRISTHYSLSGRYFQDLKDARVELRPSFFGPAGPIAFESLSHANSQGQFSKLREPVSIPSLEDTGLVDLFLPYWVLDQAGEENLRLGFSATLIRGQEEVLIGSSAHEVKVDVPQRGVYDFQVKDLKVKRELLPEADMGIWWRVVVGHETMYASRVVRNNPKPQWKAQEAARIYLCEGDKFTLELLRRKPEGKDELLDSWNGTVGQLPLSSGKSGSLKLTNVKRLNFKLDAQD